MIDITHSQSEAAAKTSALRPRRKKEAASATAYSFKVSLQSDPSVWRHIEVRDNQSLRHLHDAIQEAFDWDDDHLYEFFMSNKKWKGSSYTHPSADGPSAERAKLQALGLKPRQKFLYLFDYGDEWWHQIEVLGVCPAETSVKYPRITLAHGEPPAQYGDEDWDDAEE